MKKYILSLSILILFTSFDLLGQNKKPTQRVMPQQVYGKPTPRVNKVVQREGENVSNISAAKPINEQETTYLWTLQECIEYAKQHNLSISENELNLRLNMLAQQQAKASKLPLVSADANVGESYGRSIDPTSNQFVTKGFLYNTLGLSSQVLLFGWFQRKYQIEQTSLETKATAYAYNQLKEDISLNVATGYLRVLLAKEQVKIAEAQLLLDNEQYEQTEKFVKSGQLPELNLAQMSSQVSSDSAALTAALAEVRIALLQLKALLNLDFSKPFDIAAPDTDALYATGTYNLPTPESIYNIALGTQNQVRSNELRLKAAANTLKVAKAQQYPQLSLFANLGTNFSSNVKNITSQTYIGEVPLGNVTVAGNQYTITRPEYSVETRTRPIITQYGDNLRANGGITLAVPILNGYTARANIERAKIGLLTQQIAIDNSKQKLKQDIYRAYEDAISAFEKYKASKRAQEAAQTAVYFATKRYQVGMINTFEYTSTLNSLNRASTSALSAKYDMLFKLKVLDYYMGNPLKL